MRHAFQYNKYGIITGRLSVTNNRQLPKVPGVMEIPAALPLPYRIYDNTEKKIYPYKTEYNEQLQQNEYVIDETLPVIDLTDDNPFDEGGKFTKLIDLMKTSFWIWNKPA